MWTRVSADGFCLSGIIKTEKEVTEACGTTELGTTSMQMSVAFQKYGIKTSSVKNANINDLKHEINGKKTGNSLMDRATFMAA